MYRRLLTLLTGLALLAIPTFGVSTVAQSNPVPFEFVCSAAGRAHLSATNNADFEVRISVFSRTASSASLATSLTLGPGESGDTAVVPTTPPESGWSLIAERTTAPGGVVWEQSYSEGLCSYDGESAPEAPLPTSAVVPTATQPLPPAATLVPDETPTPPPTSVPVANSFSLTSAQRMCADQSFVATWSGANIASLELSLTNTSDEWKTGWFSVDAAAGSITRAVDHHAYDKVMAVATFDDGADETVSLNVGTCTEVPAPAPAPVDPAASTGGSSGQAVTSLPSTGAGLGTNTMVVISALSLIAVTLIVAGSVRKQE